VVKRAALHRQIGLSVLLSTPVGVQAQKNSRSFIGAHRAGLLRASAVGESLRFCDRHLLEQWL
jgi:hypothetical protein